MASSPPIRFFYESPFQIREATRIKRFLARIFKAESTDFISLNYIFCSDTYLLKINQDYLNHNTYTDIVTFNLSEDGPVLGEIYISGMRVKENAAKLNIPFKEELLRVMIHGILHLCGYSDHNKANKLIMRSKEEEYLDKFKRFT